MQTQLFGLVLKLCLILILIVIYPSTLAQALPQKYDFSCLSRDMKEEIESCFLQNDYCHAELKKVTTPSVSSSWQVIGLAALGGILGGMVLTQQLRK
jgi:hypothetical protein